MENKILILLFFFLIVLCCDFINVRKFILVIFFNVVNKVLELYLSFIFVFLFLNKIIINFEYFF